MSISAYLLMPKERNGKIPGIVCLPGHGPGKNTIVGYTDDGMPRGDIGGYQNDFAIQAARRGYAALAIEQAAFGERNGQQPKQDGCHVPTVNALMLGLTMIGIRVWDARRALDYLVSRREVDADRIGVMGISGGGTTTLFSAAVEPRFRAAFVSGFLCTFRDSIMAMPHCVDNFVRGICPLVEIMMSRTDRSETTLRRKRTNDASSRSTRRVSPFDRADARGRSRVPEQMDTKCSKECISSTESAVLRSSRSGLRTGRIGLSASERKPCSRRLAGSFDVGIQRTTRRRRFE